MITRQENYFQLLRLINPYNCCYGIFRRSVDATPSEAVRVEPVKNILYGDGAVWLNLLHFSGLLRHFAPRNDGGVYRHFDRNTWSASGLSHSRHFDRNTWSASGMYEVEKSVPPNNNYYNYRFLHYASSADAPYAPVGMTIW